MPAKKQYCYRDPDGVMRWHDEPAGKRLKCDAGLYPMVSVNAGVSADQVPEATRKMAEAGVYTQYTKDGDAVWQSNRQKQAHLRAAGLIDRGMGSKGASITPNMLEQAKKAVCEKRPSMVEKVDRQMQKRKNRLQQAPFSSGTVHIPRE